MRLFPGPKSRIRQEPSVLARTQVASKNEYRVGRVLNVKRRVITRLLN